jgi:hypothetical protein
VAKAVVLFSGSLASIVAAKLVLQQPEVREIKLLHLRSPFFREYEPVLVANTGMTHRTAKDIAHESLHATFRSQSVKKDLRVLAPSFIPPRNSSSSQRLKHGCMNCRHWLLRKALRYMQRANVSADFIVTGEVVGERGLGVAEIERLTELAGATGLVLRPLSAHLLPETTPEKMGWVERQSLKGFRASDKEKIRALARELGIETADFPAERRCKLTIPYFGPRLERLLREESLTMNALELLEFPLYYKCPPDVTIVLGRDDEEKRRLQSFFLPEDLRLYLPGHRGPMALVRANWKAKAPQEITQIIETAARVAAAHIPKPNETIQAHWRFESAHETSKISVKPFQSPQDLEAHHLKLV